MAAEFEVRASVELMITERAILKLSFAFRSRQRTPLSTIAR